MPRISARLVLAGLLLLAAGSSDISVAAQEGQPAPPRGGGRGGRGPQAPPPPPLTCTSKATEWDNKVPPALAREGFVSIFNGVDLTGWQALIDQSYRVPKAAWLSTARHAAIPLVSRTAAVASSAVQPASVICQ